MVDQEFPRRGAKSGFEKVEAAQKAADARDAARVKMHGKGDPMAPKRMPGEKYPRIVLTEGAIFHKDMLHESVAVDPDSGDHQMLSVGNMVMMTDEEFDAHRRGGVALINHVEEPQSEAAE